MINSYLKIAFRSLKRNKIYTTINLLGLCVGIACCLLISIYVYDEMSYDRFFEDSERIYRVALERQYPDNVKYFGSSPVNLARTLSEHYDEVETTGRIHRLFFQNEIRVDFGDRLFVEDKYLFADNGFFNVFSFDFIEGNPSTALINANEVVVTESTAQKYFGNKSALNQTFRLDTTEYIISGVIHDVPDNSHMDFDLLGSIHSLQFLERAAEDNNWVSPWLYTYIKLKEGMPSNALEAKFEEMVRVHGLPNILTRLGLSEADYKESGQAYNYFLQPLEDIHLKSNLSVELQANSSIFYVYLLSAIAIFILIISIINFVNLATARSSERAKEVGVRKVLGSNRSSLIGQFLTESNILSLGALALSLIAVWIVWPYFSELIGKQVYFSLSTLLYLFIGLIIFALIIGTIAGLYPAFILSKMNSAKVLKGNYKSSNKGIWLRNFLIVFQFFISVVMIAGTLLLDKQMRFVSNKPLGFSKENVILIQQAQTLGQQSEVFKNQLNKIEGVQEIGSGFAMPGDFIGNLIVNSEIPDIPQVRTFTNTVDDDYVSALGLEIVSGRNFSRDYNDSLNVLINETAMKLLGYQDAIGKKILNRNLQANTTSELNIVGVLKDYHHHSLHTEIPPLILFNSSTNNAALPSIAVKIKSENYQSVLTQIESTWDQLVQNQPISYRFLEEKLQNLYQADLRTNKVFSIFTIWAIILASVGLFGLAAYVTQQRTKEIGVRKILGASIFEIIFMLSKDLIKLILIAFLLALPFVCFGMTKWFESFAYHTDVDFFTLLGAGLFTIGIAWLTISYYSIRAAFVDIASSLKSE